MLKQISEEVQSAAEAIAAALEGLEQVSFAMDFLVHRTTHGKTTIFVTVTVWLGHEFSRKVKGGDDIPWLAIQCREVAVGMLSKMQEIAKANRPTT